MTNKILRETIDGIHIVMLNRPDVLNALDKDMIEALLAMLDEVENDDSIKSILFKGAGEKAFCAGGDIKAARTGALEAKAGRLPLAEVTDFFVKEYALNKRLFHYPKKTVSLMNGITMGGGIGVANACRIRIATEKTVWAMPEVTIGFFPDVGAGYYLSRAANNVGRYLGLTGLHINSIADLISCGLVTHFAPSSSDHTILNRLEQYTEFDGKAQLPYADIDKCFSHETVEEILNALDMHGGEWASSTAALMKTKSPTSLKVTLKHLQICGEEGFDQIIARDLHLAEKFLQSEDMSEGIRAAVIDKDRNPQWAPSELREVTMAMVDHYFN